MAPRPRRPLVIFDGDCGICTASIPTARRLVDLDAVPSQRADLGSLGLTQTQVQQQVWVIDPVGRAYGGADGVSLLLTRGQRFATRFTGHLLRLPLVRTLARGAYRLIARNRHRIPIGGVQCSIDTAPPRPTATGD